MKFSKFLAVPLMALGATAAHAAVVTVVIDDFNATASGVTRTMTGFSLPTGTGTGAAIVSDSAYTASATTSGSPALSIAVGQTPSAGNTYTLSYSYAAGTFAPGTVVDYGFNVLSNQSGTAAFPGSGAVANTVNTATLADQSAANAATSYFFGVAPGATSFNLVFNATATRAWDVVIDDVAVKLDCSTITAPTTFLSWAAFQRAVGNTGCTTSVPVPGSLALLGLGGIAAGLVSRRRAAK